MTTYTRSKAINSVNLVTKRDWFLFRWSPDRIPPITLFCLAFVNIKAIIIIITTIINSGSSSSSSGGGGGVVVVVVVVVVIVIYAISSRKFWIVLISVQVNCSFVI